MRELKSFLEFKSDKPSEEEIQKEIDGLNNIQEKEEKEEADSKKED